MEFNPFKNIFNTKKEKPKNSFLTVEDFNNLPGGTKLISISGKEATKGIDEIDAEDARGENKVMPWKISIENKE
jgi:hypothetical protein